MHRLGGEIPSRCKGINNLEYHQKFLEKSEKKFIPQIPFSHRSIGTSFADSGRSAFVNLHPYIVPIIVPI